MRTVQRLGEAWRQRRQSPKQGPLERFPGTLEGVGERSQDSGGVAEESLVEVDHSKETLKSRFIQGRRKILNG